MKLLDIHSHLADHYFDDNRAEVLSAMAEKGVGTITIGVDEKTSKAAVTLAEQHDNVWACIGVHPEDGEVFDEVEFAELANSAKVVAVGECGLDYFRSSDQLQTRNQQEPVFRAQIEFALKHNLPVMLHVRPSRGTFDAYDDVLAILKSYQNEAGEKLRGNAHFYAGSVAQARALFDLGFTISFTGVITFTHDYDEVVQFAPLDMIQAETDAPYVAPKPYRGQQCQPWMVEQVIERLAQLKGIELAALETRLLGTARRVFDKCL